MTTWVSEPGACLRTFVSPSWTIRYTVTCSAGVMARARASVRSWTRNPAARTCSNSASRSASPGCGSRAGVSSLSRLSMRRSSVADCSPARCTASSSSVAFTGSTAINCWAAPACTTITATPCDTMSCNSRAMRRRSASRLRASAIARSASCLRLWLAITCPPAAAAPKIAQPHTTLTSEGTAAVTTTSVDTATRNSPVPKAASRAGRYALTAWTANIQAIMTVNPPVSAGGDTRHGANAAEDAPAMASHGTLRRHASGTVESTATSDPRPGGPVATCATQISTRDATSRPDAIRMSTAGGRRSAGYRTCPRLDPRTRPGRAPSDGSSQPKGRATVDDVSTRRDAATGSALLASVHLVPPVSQGEPMPVHTAPTSAAPSRTRRVVFTAVCIVVALALAMGAPNVLAPWVNVNLEGVPDPAAMRWTFALEGVVDLLSVACIVAAALRPAASVLLVQYVLLGALVAAAVVIPFAGWSFMIVVASVLLVPFTYPYPEQLRSLRPPATVPVPLAAVAVIASAV